jgi:hypothetical protein
MNKIAQRFPLSILPASLLAFAIFLSLPRSAPAEIQDVQVIEITAKKYEYSASPIHVKTGTKVQLKITATDHDHGFKIAAVPDSASTNGMAGLIFTSPQTVGSSTRVKRPRLNSWPRRQARTRLGVAILAVWAIGG